jgi:hypothetical protein
MLVVPGTDTVAAMAPPWNASRAKAALKLTDMPWMFMVFDPLRGVLMGWRQFLTSRQMKVI